MPTLPQQFAGGPAPTLSVWANNYATGSPGLVNFGRAVLPVFPLAPADGVFPGSMTANTFLVGFSGPLLPAASSEAHTFSVQMGLYTLANSTLLSLQNSVSTSWGSAGTNSAFSSLYAGPRQLKFESSQWSAVPALSQTPYWVGLNMSMTGLFVPLSFSGFNWMATQFSGHVGVGNTDSSASRPFPGMGVFTSTFYSALPASIAFSDLRQTHLLAGMIPTIVIHGIGA
ncbi:MAG: hypothetical protein FD180_3477 [Planctomycetota bacterium]|nr:MAG: hypothetical protein FD180_3477 [Planctomycetota bacterium]